MKRSILLGLGLLLGSAPNAMASHYDLPDIDLVPAAVVQSLSQNQIETTEDLLAVLLKRADRAEFAKKYQMSASDVDTLAHKLEFMQIVGVGPKAAQLLWLAEVKNVTALSAAKPDVLLDALLRINREKSITGVQPDLTVVRDWIEKSKKVTNHLEE